MENKVLVTVVRLEGLGKVQAIRSAHAKAIDQSLKAPKAKNIEQWLSAPNRFDLPNVDMNKPRKQ